jgi:DNA repair protein RadC
MGGSSAIAQRWSAFREGTRNSPAPDRLCMDEKWSDLGSPYTLDCWYDRQSSAATFTKQYLLLRQLIGESHADSALIASRLLSKFGSIGDVLSASSVALTRVIEDHAIVARLLAAKPAVLEGLGERAQRIVFDLRDVTLQHWIVGLFKGLRRERIHVALLDRGKRVIFDEPLTDGELGRVEGSLRQIVCRGIGIDASGVVLMHNHPSGDVTPSAADVDETRRIAHVLSSLDMRLEDHLIVSARKIFSMKGAMLL